MLYLPYKMSNFANPFKAQLFLFYINEKECIHVDCPDVCPLTRDMGAESIMVKPSLSNDETQLSNN